MGARSTGDRVVLAESFMPEGEEAAPIAHFPIARGHEIARLATVAARACRRRMCF